MAIGGTARYETHLDLPDRVAAAVAAARDDDFAASCLPEVGCFRCWPLESALDALPRAARATASAWRGCSAWRIPALGFSALNGTGIEPGGLSRCSPTNRGWTFVGVIGGIWLMRRRSTCWSWTAAVRGRRTIHHSIRPAGFASGAWW